MITYSGVHIQKIGGICGTPTSMDIAVQSARMCRFAGAIWSPLLNHLIMVGVMVWGRSPVETRIYNTIWGLLHDAHEVVTADIPKPFKCDCTRVEQTAIDQRLLDVYLGDAQCLVDFALVKQVDTDACDIEAVQLGLPNYREVALVNAPLYRGKVVSELYSDPVDTRLFWDVRRDFEVVPTDNWLVMRRPIIRLGVALEFARARNWIAFERYFKTWGLIK